MCLLQDIPEPMSEPCRTKSLCLLFSHLFPPPKIDRPCSSPPVEIPRDFLSLVVVLHKAHHYHAPWPPSSHRHSPTGLLDYRMDYSYEYTCNRVLYSTSESKALTNAVPTIHYKETNPKDVSSFHITDLYHIIPSPIPIHAAFAAFLTVYHHCIATPAYNLPRSL